MNLYPWSSYDSVVSEKPTLLKREEVIDLFGSKEDFIDYHGQVQNTNAILDVIIEG
jgi:hypothetical protein